MDTPTVTTRAPETPVRKSTGPREGDKPPTGQARPALRAEIDPADRVSVRSQATAARAQTSDATDADTGQPRVRQRAVKEPPADPASAEILARETSGRIVAQPAVAAAAQANSEGATVLSMLQ